MYMPMKNTVTMTYGEIANARSGSCCRKGIFATSWIGVLFIVGASTNDPGKTTGLDGALKSFLSVPFGAFVLIAIGVGWIAYGIYAFFRARLALL